ncbi:MAG TPA: hypothetical protein VI251_17290, partial [Pseudolabrys sp.]
MSVRFHRSLWLSVSPIVLLGAMVSAAQAQDVLPEVVIQSQRPTPPRPTAPAVATQQKPSVASINTKLDEARDNLSPRFGASSFDINRAAIEAMPQGINT